MWITWPILLINHDDADAAAATARDCILKVSVVVVLTYDFPREGTRITRAIHRNFFQTQAGPADRNENSHSYRLAPYLVFRNEASHTPIISPR
jgi:hypothetical protein